MFKFFKKKEGQNKPLEQNILIASLLVHAAKIDDNYSNVEKEIIKDILCVAPEYGKKIASMIFKKILKC